MTASGEPTTTVEDEEPPTVPDMDQAQDLFLLELAQTNPEAVPDVQAIKAKVLAKASSYCSV